MYPPERQRAITGFLLGAGGRLGVNDIAHRLEVTGETVRRDLDVLERRGVLRRVHGGAQLLRSAPFEQALAARHAEQHAEKERIADAVIGELVEDSIVVLDSGSLTYVIAQRMPRGRALTIVTNSLPAAQILSEHDSITVLVLPGMIRGLTQASVDSWTRQRLETLSVDLAVLGVNGLTPDGGLTTTNAEEAAVKRAMLLAGRKRVLPVISSKLGRDSFCRFAQVGELDKIITDDGAEPDLLAELGAAGPEVVTV